MEIQKDKEELVPTFNLRFAKTIRNIPKKIRPSDVEFLVLYLGAFDNDMGYLTMDKEPKTLYQTYHIAMDIENTMKYSMMRGYMAARFCCPSMHHINGTNNNKRDDQGDDNFDDLSFSASSYVNHG